MPARLPRRAACAPLLALALFGCGDDPAGPATRLYQMSAVLLSSETLADGTLRNRYQTTVRDGNLLVAGAWMLFTADAGDVSPSADRTDLAGHGQVEWTLEPADYAGLGTATLSGCAQNVAPPDCTPEPLVSLSFD